MSDDETARIIGFRATGGPLYQASFPIRPGLTVLYGLNGSGKTHLLDALHSVLTGRRVGLDGEYASPQLEAALLVRAREGKFAHLRSRVMDREGWREWHRHGIASLDAELGSLIRQVEDEGSWEITAPEPRTFTPLWRVRPAVTPESESPAGRVFRAEANVWAEWLRLNSRAGEADGYAQAEARFLSVARDLGRSSDLEDLDPGEPAWDWGERVFVSAGGAVFHNEDLLPDPVDDGLPLPVTGLGDRLSGSGPWTPVDGLRVVVEGSDSEASTRLTREAVGNLEKGSKVPTSFGWVGLPNEADVAREDGWVWETLDVFREDPQSWPDISAETLVSFATSIVLESYFQLLEDLANSLYQRFLLDGPTLSLVKSQGTVATYAGRGVEWQSQGRAFAALSAAQRRWADLAVALALEATLHAPTDAELPSGDYLIFNEHTFILLDEPEAALHRTAEGHMARGLEWLARQPGVHLVVATHSPHVMDSVEARVARVHQRLVSTRWEHSALFSHVGLMTRMQRRDLEGLGLEPSDLLKRTRVLLLVEGHHDELVAGELMCRALGEQLMSRIQFLPADGGSKFRAAVESRLLFDFTDATVVPVVDNVEPNRINTAWERAQVLAASEGSERAGESLRSALPTREARENAFISQFLSRAIELGLQSRVSPCSLPAVDITDYLPVGAFVPKAKSWEELRSAHQAELKSGATKEKYFKTWVGKKYRTDFSDDRIRQALAQVDGCPEDFQALADLCARLCE